MAKRSRSAELIAALLLAGGTPLHGQALSRDSAEFALAERIELHEGINNVDLAGDGHAAMIVVGRRENFNAHSHTSLSAYFSPAPGQWDLVTFRSGDTERESIGSSEGADCALQDMRLVRMQPKASVLLVVGHRELGQGSYADASAVTFDIYELRRNNDESVGFPAEYFVLRRSITARQPYCDVDAAFAHELGLGIHGLYGLRFR